ncbi:hypothetical protein GCM10023169_34830 [Georgenia halophila]|uniref:Iron(III) transport system substrate-binding protein n=1 Tax=Georgenia halophila TaxID=620889 RepID=A0ABP8LL08_9MICO
MRFPTSPRPRLAMTTVALCGALALASCSDDPQAAATEDLDLGPLQLNEEQEDELTSLYEAAIESGNTEVTIYAGHHDEFMDIYAAFEERFPGLAIATETYSGAELQTALEAERDTGRHVAGVISNPNADRYADQGFAEEYTPVTFELPDWTEGRIHQDQVQDPDGFYHSPWALFFSAGYNTEMLEESELPANWPDFANPEWDGRVTFMTPASPGGMQTVLTTLLQSGVVDEEWLRTVASQSSLVAQDQLALQSVSSGEYPIDLTSAATSILNAAEEGAPLAVHFLEQPVIATEKWMMAAEAPAPETAKLLLNFLFTVEAQQVTLESGNFPINQHESLESPHGWQRLEEYDFVPLPSQSVMREEMAGYADLFEEVTSQ